MRLEIRSWRNIVRICFPLRVHLEENQKCDLLLDQTRPFHPALQKNLFCHFIFIVFSLSENLTDVWLNS